MRNIAKHAAAAIEAEQWKARAEAAERDRDFWREANANRHRKLDEAEATLAAVREWRQRWLGRFVPTRARQELDAILDGEGEKCPTCGGTDRTGGTVATSGPDEFGNYDTDDCPDGWHT